MSQGCNPTCQNDSAKCKELKSIIAGLMVYVGRSTVTVLPDHDAIVDYMRTASGAIQVQVR